MSLPLNWPGALDVFANPAPTQETDDAGFELDLVVSRIHNLLMAMEAKLGITASTPATGTVLGGAAGGSTTYRQIANADVSNTAGIAKSKLAALGIVDADVAAVGTANIAVGKLAAAGAANQVLATAASAPAAWQQVVTAMLGANAVSQIAFGTPTAGQVYGGAGASVAMTMSQACSNVAGGGTTLIICTGVWQHTVAGTTCFATIAQNGSGVAYETQATIPTASGYAAFAVIALTATSQGTTYTYVPYWRCASSSMALVAGAIMAVELKR